MGGGGGWGESYAPYGDSHYGPTAPKHPVRRGGQRSSLGPQVPETMDRTFDNYNTLNAGGAHQKHRHAHISTSSGVYPPPPPPPQGLLMVDRKYRNHGNDLATLRRKHAALEAKLQARAREGRPYDESDGENAEAIIFLFEIERDIARLEDGKGLDDGRGEERTGGMGFRHKKSHAGGRARPDARGHRGSFEIPNRSNSQAAAASQAGRQLDRSGHARRHHTTTEDDIAPPTRDFSRLSVRSREHGKTPRPARQHDFEDHADEASRGHRSLSELPKRSNNPAAGRHLNASGHILRHQPMTEEDNIALSTRDFSRLGVRSREHGKTPRPPRHQDLEDLYADEAPNYHQPRESLISGRHHQPSAGHGRSSSGHFADHESRAPSRHENAEDYATAESVYQSRGSRYGSYLPPTSGHGRSSSGRFADLYPSR